MPKSSSRQASTEDPRLTRFTEICLALPEATHAVHGSHASFSVRDKKFAYFLDNHHGDGIIVMTCKVLPEDNTVLSAANPKRFYIPAYLGPRGWVALRLDTGPVDWKEVTALVTWSYKRTAPKHLAAIV
jgi:predicted DNA-binding protein (MmcQ/YjbR family)